MFKKIIQQLEQESGAVYTVMGPESDHAPEDQLDNQGADLAQTEEQPTPQQEECSNEPAEKKVRERSRSQPKKQSCAKKASSVSETPQPKTTAKSAKAKKKVSTAKAQTVRLKVGKKRDYTGPFVFTADAM